MNLGTFEEMFQHESLVVFKCSIGEIDQMTLLRGAKGEEYADNFKTMLDSFAALVYSYYAIQMLS